jgi:hypothetical protein
MYDVQKAQIMQHYNLMSDVYFAKYMKSCLLRYASIYSDVNVIPSCVVSRLMDNAQSSA